MGPVFIVIFSVAGAIVVGGVIVLAADHIANRQERDDDPLPAASAGNESEGPPAGAVNMRITPSPRRQCLIAWNAAEDGEDGGTCDCLRDDVALWSKHLHSPVFFAVTDSGCAAILDHDRSSGRSSIHIVDVAGIERLAETLETEPLEWGVASGGNHVWLLCEPENPHSGVPGLFLMYAIEESIPVIKARDPRHHKMDLAEPIENVTVLDNVATLHIASGKTASVGFNMKKGTV